MKSVSCPRASSGFTTACCEASPSPVSPTTTNETSSRPAWSAMIRSSGSFPACLLQLHPEAPLVVCRVPEEGRQVLVARLPERVRVDPGERTPARRPARRSPRTATRPRRASRATTPRTALPFRGFPDLPTFPGRHQYPFPAGYVAQRPKSRRVKSLENLRSGSCSSTASQRHRVQQNVQGGEQRDPRVAQKLGHTFLHPPYKPAVTVEEQRGIGPSGSPCSCPARKPPHKNRQR